MCGIALGVAVASVPVSNQLLAAQETQTASQEEQFGRGSDMRRSGQQL